MHYIQHKIWITANMLMLMSVLSSPILQSQSIVYAGPDSGFCADEYFYLDQLNASITGAVNDGAWISSGDGLFMPDNSGNGQLSISEYYIPGPLDLQTGVFSLSLVSDEDPVTDLVYTDNTLIHLIGDVFPFCNAFLNVSLSNQCETEIDYLQLVVNPNYPIDLFEISLFDELGNEIPNQTVTAEHIGTTITYEAMQTCSGQSCEGSITIYDNFVPQPSCNDTIISCLSSTLPDSIGFPIVTDSIPILLDEYNYFVANGDNCTNLHMNYHDSMSEELCSSPYETIITRTWTLTDDYGNENSCSYNISVLRAGLSDVHFPDDFDGVTNPSLLCSDNIIVDEFGNPDPIVTGMPDAMHCQYLLSTYSDITFDFCGQTKKITREWHIIEWCSNESISMNQVIVLTDTIAPEIICLDTSYVLTNPYTCESLIERIPIPTVVDNCGDASLSAKLKEGNIIIDQWFSIQEDSIDIPQLALGSYTIEWKAIDECGNDTTCVSDLVVEDRAKPFAICIQDTKVAIGSQGFARLHASSIDNGSYDNCSLGNIKIRLLDDACLGETSFTDFVDICCDNVGQTILVEMKVTDHVGLENFCEVNVLVEDKIAPQITCPSDLTISCDYWSSIQNLADLGTVQLDEQDINPIIIFDGINNGVAGLDGLVTDNCGATVMDTLIEDLSCDQGLVYRIFYATDDFGNVDSCTQTITVINNNQLTYSDIDWPSLVTLDTCYNQQLGEQLYGEPLWDDLACSMLSYSHEDQVFEFTDGACTKIVRTFTLIDWCQYDGTNNEGIWNHEQVIKFENSVVPEFSEECLDLDLCLFADDCQESYSFFISGYDDCTSDLELDYTYILREIPTQLVLTDGNTNSFDASLSPGQYTIEWTIGDRCGNINSCTQAVSVTDCKAPSPYCNGSVTIVMNQDGEADLWISDIDLGGSDNCTNEEDLVLSFEENQLVDNVRFYCSDIENGVSDTIYQDLWFIDLAGNKEYCTASVIIQDIQDYCPNNLETFDLSGVALNSSFSAIGDLHMDLVSNDETVQIYQYSNDGEFAFQEIPASNNYQLHIHRDDSFIIGVSTLDILKIQNHILGLIPLESPYDVYAADVDGSQSVSGIDLVTMRKLILGKIVSFPNTEHAWKFVKRDDELASINPWYLSELIDVESDAGLHEYLEIMAIKLGDVNGTMQNTVNESVDTRNSSALTLNITENKVGQEYHYALSFNTDISQFDGIQLNLDLNADVEQLGFVSNVFGKLSNEHYNIIDNYELRFSALCDESSTLFKDEEFLSIVSKIKLDIQHIDRIENMVISSSKGLIINDLHHIIQDQNDHCFEYIDYQLEGDLIQVNLKKRNDLALRYYYADMNGNYTPLSTVFESGHSVHLKLPSSIQQQTKVYFLVIESDLCREVVKLLQVSNN